MIRPILRFGYTQGAFPGESRINPTQLQYPSLKLGGGPLIFLLCHTRYLEWEIEFTDEFGRWWNLLSESEQESVRAVVNLLKDHGPSLKYPFSSGVVSSRHAHMRELRIQHQGRPLRTLYAFDPLRVAILLVAGDKTGNERWYETQVPIADRLYENHLAELEKEGKI